MTTIQEVIDFVDLWRINNGVVVTPEQQIQFAQALQAKVLDLSYEAPSGGRTIIPYNGNYGDTFVPYQGTGLLTRIT